MHDWHAKHPSERYRAVEGSLVFVDISGFTRLSERLASKGKEGAEEVTEILNVRFTELLAVAYACGGSLIKFGGDALLLLFEGDGHAVRAASAAFGMRSRLRKLASIQTSSGPITLKMSVGVHSGRFDFFLVGSSHRELVIAGPDASRTVEMESAASAGEILLSPEMAAVLPPSVAGAPKGPGVLMRRGIADQMEPTSPVARLSGVGLEMFVPTAIREHVRRGGSDAEHRRVTVAFLHFDGIDDALVRHGPGEVADALDELVACAQHAVDDNGICFVGTDIDRDGGKLILVAGAPYATGADEERVLRTVRSIVDAGTRLPVRIGVNNGHVFAGDVGPAYRRTYTVMGDAVNLAARLMARAGAGEIVVAPSVLAASRIRYVTQSLEPFMVKGKIKPVTAHTLGPAVRAQTSGAAHADLPLLGRERELAAFDAAVQSARAGVGGVIEIVGGAGLGKTRLLDEIRGRKDLRSFTSLCEPYEVSTPYFAFRWLLRTLLDVVPHPDSSVMTEQLTTKLKEFASELIPWIPLLAVPLDVAVLPTLETDELDPAFRRPRLHEVVSALLDAMFDEPVMLIFEDVHWMDEASADLLAHLAPRAASSGMLLCVARRPEGTAITFGDGVEVRRMRLDPLAVEDAAALVRVLSQTFALPPHAAALLAERSGGHPLFLRELVATAHAGGDLDALPDSVESLIAARLDALHPADKTLLRVASVLGSSFAAETLDRFFARTDLDPGDGVWERLGEFLGHERGGRIRFRHALYRDAAYEALPYRRRRDLHRIAGEMYEQRLGERSIDAAESLSLHFHRAQISEKAWRYSVTAGDRAKEKFANVEAAEFYRRALENGSRAQSMVRGDAERIWEALGDVSERAGLYDDAASAYRSACSLVASADGNTAPLLRKQGEMRERQGRYTDALRWYGRGLGVAGDCDSVADRIALSLSYAGVRFRQGRMRECIRWAKSIIEDAERTQSRAALAHAYYLIYNALTWMGSSEQERYGGLALPIYQEVGDLVGQANVLNNLGVGAYFEGRWDEALTLYERSREAQERIGDVIGAATSVNNIAEVKADQGQYEEAERLFRDAWAVCRGTGYRFIEHLALSNVGRVAARTGRHDEARALLRESLEGFRGIRSERYMLETQVRIAENDVLAGDWRPAQEAIAEARTLARPQTGIAGVLAMLERLAAYAAVQSGRADQAAQHLEQSVTFAAEVNAQYELALSYEAAALLGVTAAGLDPVKASARSRGILRRLGVVTTPVVKGIKGIPGVSPE